MFTRIHAIWILFIFSVVMLYVGDAWEHAAAAFLTAVTLTWIINILIFIDMLRARRR